MAIMARTSPETEAALGWEPRLGLGSGTPGSVGARQTDLPVGDDHDRALAEWFCGEETESREDRRGAICVA